MFEILTSTAIGTVIGTVIGNYIYDRWLKKQQALLTPCSPSNRTYGKTNP